MSEALGFTFTSGNPITFTNGAHMNISVSAPVLIQGFSTHPSTNSTTTDPTVGACGTGVRNTKTYGLMKEVGATKQRTDLYVHDTEPSPGVYKWVNYDCMVSDAIAAGIDTTLIVNGFWPSWGVNPMCAAGNCPPNDATSTNALAYNYCFAAATHFNGVNGPLVSNFEVWNEVNGSTWLNTFGSKDADVAAYSGFLTQCYNGMHDARGAGIANVNVISSGVYPGGGTTDLTFSDFFTRLYSDGASFDSLAIHPYTYPSGTNGGGWTYIASTLRPLMIANGDSAKQIWITEVGSPTCGPGKPHELNAFGTGFGNGDYMTLAGQKSMALQYIIALQTMSYMGPVFWYTLYDDASSDSSDRENCFGVFFSNGTPKPIYEALRNN